jgi:hypothetical protein
MHARRRGRRLALLLRRRRLRMDVVMVVRMVMPE